MQILKRKILLILIFWLTAIYSVGQSSIGFRYGAGVSKVNFSPSKSQELIPAFSGGIVFKYIAQPIVGIQAEINYSVKGWKQLTDDYGSYYKRNVSYIEFPFLTHFHFGKRKTVFLINAGPKVSYAISAKEETMENDTLQKNDYTLNEEDDRFFDFGISGGIGINHRFPIGSLQLELRYAHSFTDVIKIESYGSANWAQNQMFIISLCYYVSFGKPPTYSD